MTTNEIRAKFLEFFRKNGHTVVPSDSLVPSGDPTLLFTSAGMVPFKKHFLNQVQLEYRRAASCQKCLRTSDIDQVGLTSRHLTFFEMLGNFSFGDYFKKEAVEWGWTFLTQECGLEAGRLYATVFKEDDEAATLWKKFLPESRIVRMGEETNFWNMGPTGPCGPCSEMLFDRGEKWSRGHDCKGPACSCDRYLEVWNLVFTQFDRAENGKLSPLPQKNIDTGMGLERLSAVVNGVESNFETDAFARLIETIRKLLSKKELPIGGLRMISDHARACTFLVGDGILPSNEGRGYILRRLLRRALRQGWIQGRKEPFLFELVPVIASEMKPAYPEISERQENIRAVIQTEEENALATIESGTRFLNDAIAKAHGKAAKGKVKLPGEKVFYIYDTFGLDKEIQREIVADSGGELLFDDADYEKARRLAVETARKGWKGSGEKEVTFYAEAQKKLGSTVFKGYELLEIETKATALLKGGKETDALTEKEEGEIVLAETPFYAESGGQVGDQGEIVSEKGAHKFKARVLDTQKPVEGLIVHKVKVLEGKIEKGAQVSARVDGSLRRHTMRHHTATHLLHAALRKTLGSQVTQAGSLVSPEKLRFDFSYPRQVSKEQLAQIEKIVNADVLANVRRVRSEMALDEARKAGALAFFGDKYGAKVYVVKYEGASTEVCGGTHCEATGDIGFFKILSEGSVGSGVRRIEAVAGEKAMAAVQEKEKLVEQIAEKLKCSVPETAAKIDRLIARGTELENELAAVRRKNMGARQGDIASRARSVAAVKILAEEMEPTETKLLREAADMAREQIGSGVVVLAARDGEKLSFVVTLTQDCAQKGFHAGKIAKLFAARINGSGGGNESFAQGGGKPQTNLKEILDSFPEEIVKCVK